MKDETLRRLRYCIVDAFASRPFEGNPAAVFLPDLEGDEGHAAFPPEDPELLQAIATEMNLSETAFPYPQRDGEANRRLRWFTPSTEVTLCGHATLAAAHVLLEDGAEAPLHFHSLSGALTVEREADGRLRLDFPADTPHQVPVPEGLAEALGIDAISIYREGQRSALVEVASEEELRALNPDFRALGAVPLPTGVMGVSVTARSLVPGVDFSSRFFGPWVGVPEDPVTGMAHTLLGVYWSRSMGRNTLEAWQCSTRGGRLTVRVADDRVHLVGSAVTVAAGTLFVPREQD
jgi:PhzF family phenazine biosynthesis protein